MSTTYKKFLVEEINGRFIVKGEDFDADGYPSMEAAREAIDIDEYETLIAQGHVDVMLDRADE